MPILIFRPEIPYSESRKFSKTVTGGHRHKMNKMKATIKGTRSFGRDDLTEGFLRYEFGGLIFGGAYTWRGLFSEF